MLIKYCWKKWYLDLVSRFDFFKKKRFKINIRNCLWLKNWFCFLLIVKITNKLRRLWWMDEEIITITLVGVYCYRFSFCCRRCIILILRSLAVAVADFSLKLSLPLTSLKDLGLIAITFVNFFLKKTGDWRFCLNHFYDQSSRSILLLECFIWFYRLVLCWAIFIDFF